MCAVPSRAALLGRHGRERREMVTKRDTAQRIGFIGLGHMGRLMVARLLAAGYTLTVHVHLGELPASASG